MMRKALGLVASAAVIAVSTAGAQKATQAGAGQGFNLGYTDVGPTVGLGGLGGAGASIGGRFEHAITALPDLGNGVLAIQATFDYYHWSDAFFNYTYVPVGVLANYHFHVDDRRIDPFLGLGLGYQIMNCNATGAGNVCSNSALYFIGRAGARYFFNPSMAMYGDIGAGAATLNLGLMFKVN